MKVLLGWLCDPYVHVFMIGLLLIRLAMGSSPDRQVSSPNTATFCQGCNDYHESWDGRCRLAGAVGDLLQGR
jgi:hypothetical protein